MVCFRQIDWNPIQRMLWCAFFIALFANVIAAKTTESEQLTISQALKVLATKYKIKFFIEDRLELSSKVPGHVLKHTNVESQLKYLLRNFGYITGYDSAGKLKEVYVVSKGEKSAKHGGSEFVQLDTGRASENSLKANKDLIKVLEMLQADRLVKQAKLIDLDVEKLQHQMRILSARKQKNTLNAEPIRFALGDGLDFDMKATQITRDGNNLAWYGQTIQKTEQGIQQKEVDLMLHENQYLAGTISLNEKLFRIRPVNRTNPDTRYIVYEVAREKLPPIE